MALDYRPEAFNHATQEEARITILQPEVGLSTDQRWEIETDWIMERLKFEPGPVIDYGCGIGRLAKRIEYPVLGVDISSTMREQAIPYVGRDDFAPISPTMLALLGACGFRANNAIAVWVLQHALNPDWDIGLIARMLTPGAALWLVNRWHRCVPARRIMDNGVVQEGWVDDKVDIYPMLDSYFELVEHVDMPTDMVIEGAFFRKYVRREASNG